jgi:transposase
MMSFGSRGSPAAPPRTIGLREGGHKFEITHVHNKAAVAVANKLARIVWAVWTHHTPYDSLRKAA